MSKLRSKRMGGVPVPSTISDGANGSGRAVNDGNEIPRISHEPEQFLTFIVVADRLGLPVFKIRRAAKQGLFPTYSFLNGRKLARLSEVEAAIKRSRSGGRNE